MNERLRSVVVDKNGTMFVCDASNRRVQRWFPNDHHGQTVIANIECWGLAMGLKEALYVVHFDEARVLKLSGNEVVAGGNGVGGAMNQLWHPHHLSVDDERSIFVADTSNNRVTKWSAGAKEGTIVAGGNGAGNGASQLNYPVAVVVDQMNTIYVLEHVNHRITRWFKGAKSGSLIIGGVDAGSRTDQLANPHSLSFDRHGNLYVTDNGNHRVQMFAIDKSSCA